MRWAGLLFCCLFLAFTVVGGNAPLLASDLEPPQANSDDRSDDNDAQTAREVAEYCYAQGEICSKICYLRSNFEDRVDGCRHSCETRVIRCSRTGCYRWPESEFLIAERFGGYKCYQ
jgi:hypothetical protein